MSRPTRATFPATSAGGSQPRGTRRTSREQATTSERRCAALDEEQQRSLRLLADFDARRFSRVTTRLEPEPCEVDSSPATAAQAAQALPA